MTNVILIGKCSPDRQFVDIDFGVEIILNTFAWSINSYRSKYMLWLKGRKYSKATRQRERSMQA